MTPRRARDLGRRIAGFVVAALACSCACMPGPPARRLVIAIESAPLTLDPRGAFNADTAHVQQLIFDTLVTKGPDFDFAPGLATSWEASADWTTMTFHLRPDVRFHDGRTLAAADVVWTFESLRRGGFGKSSAFAALAAVVAVDPLTVRFDSSGPNPGLLVDLVAVGILPDGSGVEAARSPIGTGPFRLASPYAGEGDLALTAFHGAALAEPAIDGINVRVVTDAASRALALEAGEIDLVVNPGFSPEEYHRFATSVHGARVESTPGGGVQFVVCNTDVAALADARVRRAMALAVDRAGIVANLLGSRARLAVSPLPPGHWAFADVPAVPYDPAAARRLVAESGAATPVRIELMTLPTPADRDLAAVLAESWRAVGIDATPVAVEPAVFVERLANGDFAAALHRFTGGNQFTTIFKGAFHSRSIHDAAGTRGELNYARLRDPELDGWIDAADRTAGRAERVRAYARIQARLNELVPWTLLWHPDTIAIARERVGPFTLDRGGDFGFVRTLTLP